MKVTIVQIEGELKWTDKPRPESENYHNDSYGYDSAITEWLSTLRPIKDQEGIRRLVKIAFFCSLNENERNNLYPTELKRHLAYVNALSNGIEVESDRFKLVPDYSPLSNQANAFEDIKYKLTLLPLEEDGKVEQPNLSLEISQEQYDKIKDCEVLKINGIDFIHKDKVAKMLSDFAQQEIEKTTPLKEEMQVDACAFAEWVTGKYFKIGYNLWNNKRDESDERDYTTKELYNSEEFKRFKLTKTK